MQQRYYDPIAGRFLRFDPVVTDANTGKDFGLYTYVDNNPHAKVDPDGRDPDHTFGIMVGLVMSIDAGQALVQFEQASPFSSHATSNGVGLGQSVKELVQSGGDVSKAAAVVGVAKIAAGKKFTQAQKRDILQKNREKNGGVLKSDKSGEELVPSEKSQKGVTPPPNEAQVDHIIARSKGGPNDPANAQVLLVLPPYNRTRPIRWLTRSRSGQRAVDVA